MEWLSSAFKDLNRWQIGFLVAVIIASFGATYGAYAFVSSSGERGLEENQRSIPVQIGNLVFVLEPSTQSAKSISFRALTLGKI